ncbi:type II toxin-antitoxin system PemK/MazF family toxin [Rheinheimera sp. EpRS3]|uniref:type II toxin-antitoxin system PemK/MazF family toxin n=1 Tax=Rheinheimera sp. EpRS3 TaxID=1712383 RepID=UPI000748620D|nr:type II toxin-antitoxin system PemK/MazF family toxin [Rheinheimera sp. EpRS3]KUM52197.1 hypothetical protein AR688_02510 [Rheinheimera sp. EpRS3]
MAQLKINGNVKIGHIYECEFGMFKKKMDGLTTSDKDDAVQDDYNYRIPNEMIKRRAVVVVGKHRGQYVVVPISSTKETANRVEKEPESKGFHVPLKLGDFPVTKRYEAETARWAKSNLVTTIDGGRLRDIYDDVQQSHILAHQMSEDTLKKVREGIIISIGMNSLLAIVDNKQVSA